MTLLDSARADTVLSARYRLVKLIGTGGMGSVYEARDEHTYRAVAVKLFATPDKMTTADRVRQEREIRLLSMLSHPGLIPLYDAGTHEFEDGPHRFIVMELIADTTLLRRLSEGALHNYEVADLGAQLADALAYVHSRGIVHRDVKPANILISDEGSSGFARTVKLTDFGVAHFVDGSRLTNDGTVIGTAAYLSPEQVAGEPISFATDIYSLGLVLLEALTGKQEYSGTLIEAALARLRNDPVVPDEVAQEWRDLLLRMTARDPARRPTAVAIASALRGGSTQITGPVPLGPERERHQRNHRMHRAAHRHARRGTFSAVRRWRRRNVLLGSFAGFGVAAACVAAYVAGALH
ncbi:MULTISPECIES: serine/threonine-protein kinase [Curtobacterium]|uniref:serine/threonine-protein kinase n=1 Tax=Curtobacterium TaxID=2034 RepID=UPI0018E5A940|nr:MULTISPECIES: serine/threonine-protein kinase [Curtobacterium]MCA5922326.1 serine/threonine protein kinase [Curtobacterium oceanosedimentum]QQD76628.1 serine/threonine protein kinase [Curtobacterium sp. YC1]